MTFHVVKWTYVLTVQHCEMVKLSEFCHCDLATQGIETYPNLLSETESSCIVDTWFKILVPKLFVRPKRESLCFSGTKINKQK